jgi:lipopolysaccharide assembly outer membrane protein LptD (OstA)
MEITSTGGTTYENGVATAVENVAIHIGDVDMYADSARYDNNTKVVEMVGNVRIYRAGTMYVGDRGSYNTETKELVADRLQTMDRPFLVGGERISSIDENAKLVQKASFTTHDSANPDFQIRATTVRFYENDRVILKNATFYIGRVPVFYWPYIYQSLDDAFSFVISPAYTSSWGPSLLGRVTFPLTDNVKGTLRLDYRARRGIALGFEPDIRFSKNSFARIRTYFVRDENPRINRTSLPRGAIPTDRYRYGISSRGDFGGGLSGFIRADKLSDPFLLQDFYQGEFQVNPEPTTLPRSITITRTSRSQPSRACRSTGSSRQRSASRRSRWT